MEVRDRAFHVSKRFSAAKLTTFTYHSSQLLLKKSGNGTPLVHAMRIGKSHRDVQIILLGAFSRWVNKLEDEDMSNKLTRNLLKALRE